jgi:hypothetical protein
MCQKVRKERITKVEFHELGGGGNPVLFKQQTRGGAWRYYRRLDTLAHVDYSAVEMHALAVMGSRQQGKTAVLDTSTGEVVHTGRHIGKHPALGLSYGKHAKP